MATFGRNRSIFDLCPVTRLPNSGRRISSIVKLVTFCPATLFTLPLLLLLLCGSKTSGIVASFASENLNSHLLTLSESHEKKKHKHERRTSVKRTLIRRLNHSGRFFKILRLVYINIRFANSKARHARAAARLCLYEGCRDHERGGSQR